MLFYINFQKKKKQICKKHPPFGAELIKNCKKLPNFQIDAKLEKDQTQRILIRFIVSLKEQTHVSNYNYNIILAGTDKGKLLYWKRIQLHSLSFLYIIY